MPEPTKPVPHTQVTPQPAGGRPEEKAKAAPKDVPKEAWVADVTDFNYAPWHEQNRGNEGYNPWFAGEAASDEGIKATRTMAAGDYELPKGCYDNVTGNPAFSAPNVLNPPYRWDTTGRQAQWVRP